MVEANGAAQVSQDKGLSLGLGHDALAKVDLAVFDEALRFEDVGLHSQEHVYSIPDFHDNPLIDYQRGRLIVVFDILGLSGWHHLLLLVFVDCYDLYGLSTGQYPTFGLDGEDLWVVVDFEVGLSVALIG